MIVYNDNSLDRLMINEEAGIALRKQLISKNEYDTIAAAHAVELYRPNIFIRIGLFLVTVVIVLMSFGLLVLVAADALDSNNGFFVICLIFALFIYVALEWIIQSKRHYRSGVDDALLWLTLGFIISAVNIFTAITPQQQSLLIFILSLAATIRFANSVMSSVMFFSFIGIIFYSITPLGNMGKSILPFVLMSISVIIYFIVQIYKNKNAIRHYRYCLKMLAFLSLITTYAAVNYFAVRELSNLLFDLHLPVGASIPGGWFFWLTTILIPPLYIFRALKTKDSLMLRTGLFLLAATIFTIRYYYSVAPIEVVMTAGGLILIVATYFVIRYLRTPKYGITDKEPENEEMQDSLQLESIVIAETFQNIPVPGAGEGFNFGGGSSGGGGASGEY